MDAVCPLILRDVEQARLLLLPSLRATSVVRHLWVIAPGDDVARIRQILRSVEVGFDVTVLPEAAVVPELTYFPGRKRGWFRQQLLKLAMVDLVDTDHFLALDGDICCVRECSGATFLREGRALLVTEPPGPHPDWYERASKLLGLPMAAREMSVTPVIYSRAAVSDLANHIEGNVGFSRRFGRSVPAGEPRRFLTGWRGILLRSMPWTEMSLYLTFLDGTNATDRHHWQDPSFNFYGGNVWSPEQARAWSAQSAVDNAHGNPASYFAVLGSKTGLDPQRLRDELLPHLPHLAL